MLRATPSLLLFERHWRSTMLNLQTSPSLRPLGVVTPKGARSPREVSSPSAPIHG